MPSTHSEPDLFSSLETDDQHAEVDSRRDSGTAHARRLDFRDTNSLRERGRITNEMALPTGDIAVLVPHASRGNFQRAVRYRWPTRRPRFKTIIVNEASCIWILPEIKRNTSGTRL